MESVLLSLAPDGVVVKLRKGAMAVKHLRREHFDLVIVASSNNSSSGFQTIKSILALPASLPKLLFASYHLHEYQVRHFRNAGINGCLRKRLDLDEMKQTLEAVIFRGERIWPQHDSETVHNNALVAKLTHMELQVVHLTAEDLTCKEIAFSLGISAHTVADHRKSIVKKLGVRSIAGVLAVYFNYKPLD